MRPSASHWTPLPDNELSETRKADIRAFQDSINRDRKPDKPFVTLRPVGLEKDQLQHTEWSTQAGAKAGVSIKAFEQALGKRVNFVEPFVPVTWVA